MKNKVVWKWFKAAGIRALRTFGQSALAYMGTGAMVLGDVNWLGVLSAGALGAVISLLMALQGLPEVPSQKEEVKTEKPEEDKFEVNQEDIPENEPEDKLEDE